MTTPTPASGRGSATLPAPRRGPSTRAIALAAATLLAVLLGALLWVGVRAALAAVELSQLMPLVGELQSAAASGDLERMDGVTESIAERSAQAASLTGDPVWRVAEVMPQYGPNFAAVRVIAAHLDEVASAATEALSAVAAAPQVAGAPLDLTLIAESAEPLAAIAGALAAAETDVEAMREAQLLGPIRSAVRMLAPAVAEGARLASAMADAAAVLPPVLGANGPRTVLVMVQNNAEVRTGGGITGSFALLSAQGGIVELVAQADSSQFPARAESILPLPAATVDHYGDVVGRYVQNTSSPSDFALTADLAVAWWHSRTGVRPDAVLSIDAAVARSALSALGPVSLPDGSQLDAGNVVQRLLIDAYTTLDNDAQTAFQQATTAAILDRLLLGDSDPLRVLGSLAGPIADGHVALWSADPEEQATLSATALGGALARHRDADEGTYAVYLNDATGGKMDLYLETSIGVAVRDCRADDRREVTVTLTMRSAAPPEVVALPISVTGGGLWGTAVGDIGTLVSVAAPADTFFGGVSKNGEPEISVESIDGGFPMSTARVNLSPAEENTMAFRFIAAEPGRVAPSIIHTPLLTAPDVAVAQVGCG